VSLQSPSWKSTIDIFNTDAGKARRGSFVWMLAEGHCVMDLGLTGVVMGEAETPRELWRSAFAEVAGFG
jgi:hypothetical protein